MKLITGHKGFIGKNLISHFSNAIGIDNDYNKEQIGYFLSTTNPDVVFHVGACSDTLNIDVNYILEKNYLATKWITDWCINNNKKIIYSSSAAIYGTDGKQPSNLYGWSKLLGEDYVINKGGIALRYFNVYGPGEEHKRNMASIIYQNYKKDHIKLFPGRPKRDFVYIEDVVNANLFAFENYDHLKGTWYDVGSGENNEFEKIFKILNIPYSYLNESDIPKGYQFNTLSKKENWMPGWKPKYNLEQGINQYKKYLNEKD